MLKKTVSILTLSFALMSGIVTVSAHAKSVADSTLEKQEQTTDKMQGDKMQGDKMTGKKKKKKKSKKLGSKMEGDKMAGDKMEGDKMKKP